MAVATAASTMAALLPSSVAVAEWPAEVEPPALTGAEAILVARAAPRRRREVAAGRACARAAMAALGHGPAVILRGPDREPVWPAGLVGSITHCSGYCAAAVAAAGEIVSIGIDAEAIGAPLDTGILDQIAGPAERAWVDSGTQEAADRLLFSAKESVYKAWFPLARRWLGFDDATVAFDAERREFEAVVRDAARLPGDPAELRRLRGRYLVTGALVLTAVVVRSERPGPRATCAG